MKRLLILAVLLVVSSIVLTACGGSSSPTEPAQPSSVRAMTNGAPDEVCGETTVCMLGGQKDIGTVRISNTDECLWVDFQPDPGWVVLETQVDVATSFNGLHTNKAGRPRIGHFPYEAGECIDLTQFDIECDVTELFIAAHAVVENDGQRETAWACGELFTENRGWSMWLTYTPGCCDKELPELPTDPVCIKFTNHWGLYSYFNTQVWNVPSGFEWLIDGWDMNGYWKGWCADLDTYVYLNRDYCNTMLLSSYDDFSAHSDPRLGAIEWPKINHILNNKVGNKYDVQDAIWYFTDNDPVPPGSNAETMVNAANANPDFFPGEGEWFAVICWISANNQLTFIEVDP